MPKAYTALFYHFIWATWKRQPFLKAEIQDGLYGYIGYKCKDYGGVAYAINGMEEHIHVVVRLPATVAVADIVGKLKGSSSRFLSEKFKMPFKWQEGYGALTFGKRDLEKLVSYVDNQKKRHQNRMLNDLLECLEDEETDADRDVGEE
jgi:putative transposase